jgi:hypothetical protein
MPLRALVAERWLIKWAKMLFVKEALGDGGDEGNFYD